MTETTRYTAVAITLHWLIALFIVMLIFVGWRAGDMADAVRAGTADFTLDDVRFVYNMHKTFGIMVLALSLVRLGWRLFHPAPPLPAHMPAWEKLVARATHVAFYVMIIGMPLVGWVMISASRFPSYFFNNPAWRIPEIGPDSEALNSALSSLHSAGAWVIVVLIVLHAGAALKHHVINKDDVLARMFPFLRRK